MAYCGPKWLGDDVAEDTVIFGTSSAESRVFAAEALERRLKVIGLAAAA